MPPKLKVSGQPVEFSNTAKYLGVTLDHNLTWSTHLTNQITKGKRYLFMLKKAVLRNWGPKPKFIKWMIDTIFMKSCLLYTSPSPRDLSTSRMPSSA